MEICKECGGRYYDKPDGGKLPLLELVKYNVPDEVLELELKFLRIPAELKDIKKETPETGKCQTPKE